MRCLIPLAAILLPALVGLTLLGDGPDDPPLAFVGARLHPVAGPPIESGVLVVHKRRIQAVGGPDTPIPTGARKIDARGKVIIPGLVDTHSHIGIFGRPNVSAHADGNEGSGP